VLVSVLVFPSLLIPFIHSLWIMLFSVVSGFHNSISPLFLVLFSLFLFFLLFYLFPFFILFFLLFFCSLISFNSVISAHYYQKILPGTTSENIAWLRLVWVKSCKQTRRFSWWDHCQTTYLAEFNIVNLGCTLPIGWKKLVWCISQVSLFKSY